MAWDLSWLAVRLLLVFSFLGIGLSIGLRLWRHGQTEAAFCPECGLAMPLSRTKPHQHCRRCGKSLVENHTLLPGVRRGKVGSGGSQ